jgi:hypothetical protein
MIGFKEKLMIPMAVWDISTCLAYMVNGYQNLPSQVIPEFLPDIIPYPPFVGGDGNQGIPVIDHFMYHQFGMSLRVL